MFKDEFTRRRILALPATVPALLARGPFFASYASAEEADDDAALKKQFEFLRQERQRGMLGQIRGGDRHYAGRCEAPGFLLRADG
jgi:hypothetical protein